MGARVRRCLGGYLSGVALTERDRRGRLLRDDNFLVLFNAHHDTLAFQLPAARPGMRWQVLLDTAHAQGLVADGHYAGYDSYPLTGRSLALLVDYDTPRITP
jgi:isoamylase